jgi:hypothetical protein
MRGKARREFVAVPIVAGLLGVLFLVYAAAVGGLGWWLVAGAVIASGVLLTAVWAVRYSKAGPDDRAPAHRPRETDGVHRVLVIADNACGSEVRSFVRSHSAGPTQVRVLAPVLASGLSLWTGDEGQYQDARLRLNETVATLRAAGIEADGRLGTEDPLRAADDGLSEFSADELLFALRDERRARAGGERDLVARAQQRYEIPVSNLG